MKRFAIAVFTAAVIAAPAAAQTPPAAPPAAPPVHFRFDLNQTPVTSHNGRLNGGGWATGFRAAISWNHIDDTISWKKYSTAFGSTSNQEYWDEWYWDDDLDYCDDWDYPDGQIARVNGGISYERLSINDSGFRYDGDGLGWNTGFSLKSAPHLTDYGRITYFPTITTSFMLPGTGQQYQVSKQQYDFGVRYTPSLTNDVFIEGGFNEEVLLGKGSQSGAVRNYGPYLGVGARF